MSASSHHAKSVKKPLLGDSTYNKVKKSATIVLPALSALYIGLAGIWGFPHVEQVVGTLTVLNTVLGGLIQDSKKSYYAANKQYVGELVPEPHPTEENRMILVAHLNQDPSQVAQMDEVVFKVK